jgi:two-component system chemotaxis response regulator CheB
MARSVLIVDDSFVMRVLLKSIVESDPELAVCALAENGKVALERYAEHAPDAVLLDIEMPELDGLGFLEAMPEGERGRVIVVSAVAQAGAEQTNRARALGACAVIDKPSGALGLDLAERRGHVIVKALRQALGLPEATA